MTYFIYKHAAQNWAYQIRTYEGREVEVKKLVVRAMLAISLCAAFKICNFCIYTDKFPNTPQMPVVYQILERGGSNPRQFNPIASKLACNNQIQTILK